MAVQFTGALVWRAILYFCLLTATAGCSSGSGPVSPINKKPNDAVTEPGNQPQRDSVTLSWEPPSENTDGSTLHDLAGYRIYSGQTADDLTLRVTLDNPGLTRYVVEPLAPGELYFALSALNSNGVEGALSAVIQAPPNG
jgi:hypothetical protein